MESTEADVSSCQLQYTIYTIQPGLAVDFYHPIPTTVRRLNTNVSKEYSPGSASQGTTTAAPPRQSPIKQYPSSSQLETVRTSLCKTPDFPRRSSCRQPENLKKKDNNVERSGSLRVLSHIFDKTAFSKKELVSESTPCALSERRGSLEASRLATAEERGARRKSSESCVQQVEQPLHQLVINVDNLKDASFGEGRGLTPIRTSDSLVRVGWQHNSFLDRSICERSKKDTATPTLHHDKYSLVAVQKEKYIPPIPHRKSKPHIKDEFTEFSEYGSRFIHQDQMENTEKKCSETWLKESSSGRLDNVHTLQVQKSMEMGDIVGWTQTPSPRPTKRHIFSQHTRYLPNIPIQSRSGPKSSRGFSSISDSDSGFEGDSQANLDIKIKHLDFQKEYDMIQQIGEGWFSRVYLTEHRQSREEVVLKAINSDSVSLEDFYREYQNSYLLSTHAYILTVFDCVFQAGGYYMFGMEYAPLGDLTSNTTDQGVGECHTKSVAIQIGSALEWIHSKNLCHLDVKLDNILVFKSDFSLVKLCDFGSIKTAGDIVIKKNELLPYCPPELMAKHANEYYQVDRVQDVFQFGIVIFFCLCGILPWQKADIADPNYNDFYMWRKKATSKVPRNFKTMTSRSQKLFRKLLDPEPSKRLNLCELTKYIEDKWVRKGSKSSNEAKGIGDGLSQLTLGSFQSVHSNAVEKNKMLYTLLQHGVETTVDRSHKNNRIISWIKQGAESTDHPNVTDIQSQENLTESYEVLKFDDILDDLDYDK